jgi:hypothetical protein
MQHARGRKVRHAELGKRAVGGILLVGRRLRGTGNKKRVFENLNSFGLEHRPVAGSYGYGRAYLGSVKRGKYLKC